MGIIDWETESLSGDMVSAGALNVPGKVWIDPEGPYLRVSYFVEKDRTKERIFISTASERTQYQLLDNFLTIRNNPEMVKKFAQRYGLLGLCSHGMPQAHQSGCGLVQDEQGYREPLHRWYHYVEIAKALTKIAVSLTKDERAAGAAEDWRTVTEALVERRPNRPFPSAEWLSENRHGALVYFVDEVNWWIRVGNLWPEMSWLPGAVKPLVQMGAEFDSGAFGRIGYQIMLSAAGAHYAAWCDGCGEYYLRKRKAQAGRENYCETCKKKKIPGRTRQSRMEQRRRRARMMASEGVPSMEIAEEVGSTKATIEGWLRKGRQKGD